MRRVLVICMWAAMTVTARADVILSAAVLNDALKEMERLSRALPAAPPASRAALWFSLGTDADSLATLMTSEVAAHGWQERMLIDLGLKRCRELRVTIAYDELKTRFFYDNAAFATYLTLAPHGIHAAEAAFEILDGEFFRLTNNDLDAILAASEHKRDFLSRYPTFTRVPEVRLMLSIDYRDLAHLYASAGDASSRDRYRDLERQELQLLMRTSPQSEQAEMARRMLQRFDADLGRQP